MAWYGSRTSELNDLLNRANEGAPDQVRRALTSGIANATKAAEGALGALADYAERVSAGNLGTQRKWEDRCRSAITDISRCFGDAAKDHTLTPAQQLFWYQALAHEEAFFEKLSKVRTPQLHDDLLVHQDTLNKMLGELWDKWTYLLSKDVAFETDERKAVREVAQLAEKLVGRLEPLAGKLREHTSRLTANGLRKVQAVLEKFGEHGGKVANELLSRVFGIDIPEGVEVKDIIDLVQGSAQYMEADLGTVRSQIALYKSLVQAELGSVLLLFTNTRKDVERYRNDNDLGKARVWLDQAKGALSDWASSVATSGQRSDASAFRDKIAAALDTDWKLTEELDSKFRDKFKGVFIAPLGDDTLEQLVEGRMFRQELEEVTRKGVHSRARELASNLQSQTSSELDNFFRQFDDLVARAPDEIREMAKMKNEEFKRAVKDKLRERIDRMLPVIRLLAELFAPSNLQREFSRDELERAVK
jgi:hypothetical protein